jgi:hypothetical protein
MFIYDGTKGSNELHSLDSRLLRLELIILLSRKSVKANFQVVRWCYLDRSK